MLNEAKKLAAVIILRFFVQQNLPWALVEENVELSMTESPLIFEGIQIFRPETKTNKFVCHEFSYYDPFSMES